MVDIEFIRKKHYVEGWSIRKIARNFGISRQSVRKALASAEMPRYRRTRPRPFPVMNPYRAIILAWLEADAAAPPKQRHTAKRIYDRLVEEYGFIGAESPGFDSSGPFSRHSENQNPTISILCGLRQCVNPKTA